MNGMVRGRLYEIADAVERLKLCRWNSNWLLLLPGFTVPAVAVSLIWTSDALASFPPPCFRLRRNQEHVGMDWPSGR